MTFSNRNKRYVERHQSLATVNMVEDVKANIRNNHLPDMGTLSGFYIPPEVLTVVTHNHLPSQPAAIPTRKKIFGLF